MEPKPNYQRLASTEMVIRDILEGDYVQTENDAPNYLLTKNKIKVMYVNVIVNVLRKETMGAITNFWVDDGTGQIMLRFFEENKKTNQLQVGDVVLIIGRPRLYNEEKYISPEIVSKVDPQWLKIRSLKLNASEKREFKNPLKEDRMATAERVISPLEEEIVDEEKGGSKLLPAEKIAKLIKELDSGSGALIETVLEQSVLANTEQILKRMLESGEIFQNSPGKVKVL